MSDSYVTMYDWIPFIVMMMGVTCMMYLIIAAMDYISEGIRHAKEMRRLRRERDLTHNAIRLRARYH